MPESLLAIECPCCGSQRLSRTPAVLMPFVAHRAMGWPPTVIDASWGLATVPSGMAYSRVTTLQCAVCDVVFVDLRFGDREMEALYADYRGADYVALRDSYEPGYAERNEQFEAESPVLVDTEHFLEPLLPSNPAVLDWGGDSGINMPFRNCARLRDVYDISSVAMLPDVRARHRDELDLEFYDLIVLSHVLEHVPDPAALLADAAAVLHSDSVLYVEVPHEAIMREGDVHTAGSRKRHWHEHINFFTPEGLRLMTERIGLRIIAIESFSASGLAAGAVIRLAAKLRV